MFGVAFFDEDLSVDRFKEEINTTPRSVSTLTCTKKPTGETVCSSTGGVTLLVVGVQLVLQPYQKNFY
ncbi:hypothetical protein [Helicobacter cappadocius]|uniref:Uncharacterized protein n=1 Tax=Helicobacter cappadocius TaxID=3063998 RepID=A0AA90T576_9HELI|nr:MULTISPECIES: hypothetical protein [unclassified Helicobacter]MDO7253199.1 hypothetical protein [Helicobacter sp. faydin-H75]MDP2539123.1 hypothetical protein [Helicobacter sp. faydin-H76]